MTCEIPLSQGKVAVIDKEDSDKVSEFKWSYDGRYATKSFREGVKHRKLYLHRFILCAKDGDIVDHVNRNTLDNRKENLRISDYQGNSANCRLHAHNTTGYKGVYRFYHGRKPWRAAITYKDKQISLGYYDNPEDAARAYNKKALELFGDFANLNVITENKEGFRE